MAELIVGLGDRSYPIVIEKGCLAHIGQDLQKKAIGNRYCVIADDRVAELYGEVLLQSLSKAGLEAQLLTFPRGESNKNLSTVATLASSIAKLGFDRKDAIIAFGGGVSGDIAGFVASSYIPASINALPALKRADCAHKSCSSPVTACADSR